MKDYIKKLGVIKMKKLNVDGLELTKEQIQLLLAELKDEKVNDVEDLKQYLKGYWYTKDMARKSHLLMSDKPKKKNFALPFDE